MNKGSLIYRRYLSVEKPHPFWFYICGFNISILGGLFAVLFLRLLGRRRRFLAVSLSLLAIGSYTLLVGAGASVVRAAIMGVLGLFAVQLGRRQDGREMVFASNRSGGLGGFDIWSASRDSIADPWSAPVNLGSNVNSAANETRPSLSWDALTLLFGTTRPGVEGVSDIFYATREQFSGP